MYPLPNRKYFVGRGAGTDRFIFRQRGFVMVAYPQTGEYAEYYGRYIKRVPEGSDIFALLSCQPDELSALLVNVTDEQANIRPAPYSRFWSGTSSTISRV